MKIISYNVNGIRAALNKGFIDWLKAANPDVICLQEIKANKEQLDLSVFEDAGYNYHYWFSAQKKGYSGVAILSKIEPKISPKTIKNANPESRTGLQLSARALRLII